MMTITGHGHVDDRNIESLASISISYYNYNYEAQEPLVRHRHGLFRALFARQNRRGCTTRKVRCIPKDAFDLQGSLRVSRIHDDLRTAYYIYADAERHWRVHLGLARLRV